MGVRIFGNGGEGGGTSFYWYNAIVSSSGGVLTIDSERTNFPSSIAWANKATGEWALTFVDGITQWDVRYTMVTSNYADISDVRLYTFLNLDYSNTTPSELRLMSFNGGTPTNNPTLTDDFLNVAITIVQFIP
jgi:hypothetical protein